MGKGTIRGDVLHGPKGMQVDITKTAFEFVLDGKIFTAELKTDGKLHWSDGDIWNSAGGGGAQKLEGDWDKGTIRGDVLHGTNGAKVGITKTAFEMVFEGSRYKAELQSDGKLHWSDGDIWTKKDSGNRPNSRRQRLQE